MVVWRFDFLVCFDLVWFGIVFNGVGVDSFGVWQFELMVVLVWCLACFVDLVGISQLCGSTVFEFCLVQVLCVFDLCLGCGNFG